jgi:BirA family biotin operon repressor/biotin-[acetyl-CoA-carboxylase] ligase
VTGPDLPPPGPFADLDRPPLRAAALARALVGPPGPWTSLRVVERTGSTMDDLAGTAAAGGPAGTVLVAESQTAARGRLGRAWTAPPRSGLALSVLLDPGSDSGSGPGGPALSPDRLGWLPLLAGVAAAESLERVAGTAVRLKWPNDLLVRVDGAERKLAGILSQRVAGGMVVLGIGVNVTLGADELPVPTAGSLALAGAATTDRDTLLRALLRELGERWTGWREAGGDPEASGLREDYLRRCATLGREVVVTLPAGRSLHGTATGVDGDGRLLVRVAGEDAEPRAVDAGDVVHVRNR